MTGTPERLTAALRDHYAIERELGQGGMATVYLARDLRHQRQVALKVLRPELAAIIGAERFLQEIRTTANLQHPHILALHDSGTVDGTVFYVMPLVEGESLRDRLQREKQLPVDDAVRLCQEVAAALDYAHRHGVIHRDVKPENILLHDGQALVADFGIALAASGGDSGSRLTETGVSLGTPHYMSPEQAMGERNLDARTDVYALGCVLYEMLTGEPPFTGPTAQAIVARVMTDAPRPIRAQRRTVPEHVEASIARALEKLPADRFATAAEFAAALESPGFRSAAPATDAATGPDGEVVWRRRSWIALGAAAVFAALFGWSQIRPSPEPAAPVTRFAVSVPSPGAGRATIALTRDGRRVITHAIDSLGQPYFVSRSLDGLATVPIPGTEGAEPSVPGFSPDGRWMAFTVDGKLRKIPVDGGSPVDLTGDSNGQVSWESPDWLIGVSAKSWGLIRVPAEGGPAEVLTVPDTTQGEIGHWEPEVLPGGHAVIFTSYRTPASRVEAYDIRSGRRTKLVDNAIAGRYASTGHLLFVRDGTLYAARFDPERLVVIGGPVPVVEDVSNVSSDATAAFAVSAGGTLAYIKESEWSLPAQLVWVTRDGREETAIPQPGLYTDPRISPDGRRIAATIGLGGGRNIWLYDTSRRALTQLTRADAAAFRGAWTPDSRSIVFTLETPAYDLYRIAADGSSPPEAVVTDITDKYVGMIGAGNRLAYEVIWANARSIVTMPLDGGAEPVTFADPEGPGEPQLSPDGRWLAYSAGAGGNRVLGRWNVFVRAADGTGPKHQVSIDGGSSPRWTRGGREIVFRHRNTFLAAAIDPATGDVAAPVVLFGGAYGPPVGRNGDNYDVTPDGSRFLVAKPLERPGALPVIVALNWFQELRDKVKP